MIPEYKQIGTIPIGIQPAEVVHVEAGSYAVVDVAAADGIARLLSSTGFCECMGVLACVKDAEGKPIRWALAHLTIKNDPVLSIQNMMGELSAGLDGARVEIDLVGGYKNFGNSDNFYERAIATLSSMPNVSIKNDLMFNKTYTSEICVNLSSGQKFSGRIDGYNQSDVAETLIKNAAKQDGECKDFVEKKHQVIVQKKAGIETPAVKFDWEKCLPEMAQIWKTKRASIMADLKREFEQGWGCP